MNLKQEKVNVIAKPPLVYLITIGSGLILHFLWPVSLFSHPAIILLGLALLGLSLALMYFADREFQRAGTAVSPDEPPTTIVRTGPFCYSRNPMYLAFIGIQIGIALAIQSGWVLATLLPALVIMEWGVIRREEHYLEKTFAEEYLSYKASVRRWF